MDGLADLWSSGWDPTAVPRLDSLPVPHGSPARALYPALCDMWQTLALWGTAAHPPICLREIGAQEMPITIVAPYFANRAQVVIVGAGLGSVFVRDEIGAEPAEIPLDSELTGPSLIAQGQVVYGSQQHKAGDEQENRTIRLTPNTPNTLRVWRGSGTGFAPLAMLLRFTRVNQTLA